MNMIISVQRKMNSTESVKSMLSVFRRSSYSGCENWMASFSPSPMTRMILAEIFLYFFSVPSCKSPS